VAPILDSALQQPHAIPPPLVDINTHTNANSVELGQASPVPRNTEVAAGSRMIPGRPGRWIDGGDMTPEGGARALRSCISFWISFWREILNYTRPSGV